MIRGRSFGSGTKRGVWRWGEVEGRGKGRSSGPTLGGGHVQRPARIVARLGSQDTVAETFMSVIDNEDGVRVCRTQSGVACARPSILRFLLLWNGLPELSLTDDPKRG